MEALAELWAAGGFVMPWLGGSTVVLWWAIGERAYTLLGRGPLRDARRRLAARPGADEGWRQELTADAVAALDRHRVLIASIAATAPLVGLLGTVSGMIETFDALTTMSLHSGSGGIAGGISEALISTPMGLCGAIPGLLAGRLLERAQRRLEDDIAAIGAEGAWPS